jgi:hypothetical protein
MVIDGLGTTSTLAERPLALLVTPTLQAMNFCVKYFSYAGTINAPYSAQDTGTKTLPQLSRFLVAQLGDVDCPTLICAHSLGGMIVVNALSNNMLPRSVVGTALFATPWSVKTVLRRTSSTFAVPSDFARLVNSGRYRSGACNWSQPTLFGHCIGDDDGLAPQESFVGGWQASNLDVLTLPGDHKSILYSVAPLLRPWVRKVT